ncbi:hypothetical protein DAPPUDRAFT_264894 [Daphnia pulex]|uniref:Uncharacterized protein n=1 Tax=Daphnia pulex TaxID=6669 RepID=E9HSI3_DAPPU|nr:hypothetical protein DAPPUDRAFT_264894 [Daphnia pulex]|eukprot:EFX65295.1 hypothetical protein DAPPUDRAFT_264894 [Daphnia pulex]
MSYEIEILNTPTQTWHSQVEACTSALLEPSYILRTIGAEEDLGYSSIRFGIGRFTTKAEVDYTAQNCIHQVTKLREISV